MRSHVLANQRRVKQLVRRVLTMNSFRNATSAQVIVSTIAGRTVVPTSKEIRTFSAGIAHPYLSFVLYWLRRIDFFARRNTLRTSSAVLYVIDRTRVLYIIER